MLCKYIQILTILQSPYHRYVVHDGRPSLAAPADIVSLDFAVVPWYSAKVPLGVTPEGRGASCGRELLGLVAGSRWNPLGELAGLLC